MRLAALAVVSLVLASTGPSASMPQPRVGTAIVRAFPAATTTYWNRIPKTCHALDISVSANGRFARVQSVFTPTDRCVRFASDGYDVLQRAPSGAWRIVFEGSDLPPCSLSVPRDLVRGCSRS